GTGIVGVAPQAKIMPVKIKTDNGFNATEAYANGILYAALNGADVINLSWGCSDCTASSGNPAVADAISVARGLGAIVVTSAGNWRSDVKDAFPAGIPDVLTVSSTDVSDGNSAFSNRGFLVDVAAPGGQGWYDGITANYSILSLKSSTVGTLNGDVVGGTYLRSTGTSASAAYVSGVAALVLSANPALTSAQVAAIIRQSADDQLGSPLDTPGYDPYFGWGRVNAARAVAMAQSPPADPPQLRVSSEGFSFNIPQALCGQERSFTFDIFNIGGGDLTWSITPPAWLSPLTSSGSGNASPVVKITANNPANGAITVSSNGSGPGTSDVPVSVAVLPDIKLTNCTMALSTAPGNQEWDQPRNSNPPAVADGSGGAYYVWFGPDSTLVGNYHVYIQHVDSNGAPLWTANGIRLSSADKFQYNPTVISDGAGGAIVLWTEGLNTGDYADKNFAAQRVNSAGELLWGGTGIAVTQGGNVINPVLIADGSGGATIGWTHLGGAGSTLVAQRISASGTALWPANGVLLTQFGSDQMRATADGSGGAWFAWVDYRNPFDDIYGQHLDQDGVPLWPQNGNKLNSQPLGAIWPNLVADGAGGAIVAWYDYRNHPMSGDALYSSAWDIYAMHLDSAGQQIWSPAEILVVGGTTVMPWGSIKMLSDGQGGAIIAWLDHRNRATTLKEKKEVYAQRINGAGQPLWSPAGVRVLAADGWDIAPTIIPDRDSGALFAWQDKRFGSLDIFLQQLKSDGSLRWGTNGIWAHSGSKDQTDPYLVPLGGNRLAITW
ncbi:MAG TPA: S8 family serine peptidase, partial [Geobacteraceae bacterium]